MACEERILLVLDRFSATVEGDLWMKDLCFTMRLKDVIGTTPMPFRFLKFCNISTLAPKGTFDYWYIRERSRSGEEQVFGFERELLQPTLIKDSRKA